MKRREFIGLLGGAAVAWPLAARAQQAGKVHHIGFLTSGTLAGNPSLPTLVNGLKQLGWIEGSNVTIEYRAADDHLDRLPELAAELVRLNVDVIVAAGTLAPLAAKHATTTIPIVMTAAADPLGTGLVAGLARPGGNVTGLSLMSPDLAGKRLELLKEIVPGLARVAVLWNAANPYGYPTLKETENAGRQLKIEVESLEVRVPEDVTSALEAVVLKKIRALIPFADPLILNRRNQIADFATKNRLAAVSGLREFVDAGLLLSYGEHLGDLYLRAAGYVNSILNGTNPADLPVQQPTKYQLIVNLATAKSIGLTIPESFLLRADEVIE